MFRGVEAVVGGIGLYREWFRATVVVWLYSWSVGRTRRNRLVNNKAQ